MLPACLILCVMTRGAPTFKLAEAEAESCKPCQLPNLFWDLAYVRWGACWCYTRGSREHAERRPRTSGVFCDIFVKETFGVQREGGRCAYLVYVGYDGYLVRLS